jgi:hypothetical protein
VSGVEARRAAKEFVGLDAAEAAAFGQGLVLRGVPPADVATLAWCLVRAALRGIDRYGLQFRPQYRAWFGMA